MKKVFVTGATGFIGEKLCYTLADKGFKVMALYRSEEKAKRLQHNNIELYKGNISNVAGLEKAINQCDYIYHLAAYASVWAKEKDKFYNLNYTASLEIIELAIKHNVKKVVITSTAGVFGPSKNTDEVDENTLRYVDYFSQYEETKDRADKEILEKCAQKIDVCIVCPSRVYGPGELSESNAVTKIIKMYARGKFRTIPGNGNSIGNYVFIDDVVKGMILAMEKGKTGERYLLGGENISFKRLFATLSKLCGKKYWMIKIPARLIVGMAQLMLFIANVFNTRPLITPNWARKYLFNWLVSSNKAKVHLGYAPISFEEGAGRTLEWLNKGKAGIVL